MRLRFLLALGLVAAPGPLAAQRLVPAGVSAPHRPAPRASPALRIAAADQHPRAWPYVVGGAAIGALATAGAIVISMYHTDSECICSPLVFAPVVAGGTVLGAGAGYAVYRVRF